jgi:hypothetical protein
VLSEWSMAPVVEALQALRGVALVNNGTPMTGGDYCPALLMTDLREQIASG